MRSRAALTLGLIALAALVRPLGAGAEELVRRHAIAKIGSPSLPADFRYFDWVNPDAPKGGLLRLSSVGSFDNLNAATIKGRPAPGLVWLNDTLMAPSPDEPATAYALIAEWVAYPDDFTSATFGIRPEARFWDGRPITPADVVFSFEAQKEASPAVALYYKDVTKAEISGEREVTFRFAKAGNRDLPYIVSLLAILPKHYWTDKSAGGQARDLNRTTLEPPLGSGPYRIGKVDTGRAITFERVRDYWAAELPVNRGQYNFDAIRFSTYRDDIPEFEALKTGEVDLREENSSRRWATGYDFPAVRDGRVKRLDLTTKTVAQFQSFLLNTRLKRFEDARVRRAFALAYDFESANKSLFFGLYRRINSVFDNSELAHRGKPEGRELEILDKLRDKVPPEVFGDAYRAPVSATLDELRRNLREAGRLLAEAGWKFDRGAMRNVATGEPMTVEFLSPDTSFDRIVLPYKQNLEKLGIVLNLRVVDPSQYEERLKRFDFEMITDTLLQSHAPGNEQRERFGSDSATKEASSNRAGIRSPAVDAIIEDIIYARTRDELVAAARALDRVIMWSHYFVPQWYNPVSWIAHWDKFGRPPRHPSQDPSVTSTWWLDAEAARRLETRDARR